MSRLVDLARQVEYYFTKQNLSTDTYLKRLRQLNDGCVPLSILANFARVRAIAITKSKNREKTIIEALNKHSTLLSIYSINTANGKRQETVDSDNRTDGTDSASPTILAVGLANESEHPPDTVGLALIEKDNKDFTDTIILRDVHPSVGEDEIRALFEAIDGCPPVVNVCADVGQCWFVKLETTDRTDMMKVMLTIRSLQFPSTGDYVLARLKASVSIQPPPPIRRGRRKRRGKRSKKAGSVSPAPSTQPGVMKSVVSLPCLTSDQFPALHYNTFEWDTAPTAGMIDDDDATKEDPKSLDAASTATTTSSTATHSSNGGEKLGYAAALMKTPSKGSVPPAVQESAASSDSMLQWNRTSME